MGFAASFRILLAVAALVCSAARAGDAAIAATIDGQIESLRAKIERGRVAADRMRELQAAVVERKDAKAYAEIEAMAGKGNPSALVFLGCLNDQGLGGRERDSYRAAQYFDTAARRGDAIGLYDLALLYLHGRGLKRDEALANRLLQIAARANSKHASVVLGMLAEQRKDWSAAARWYREASGHPKHDLATLKIGLFQFRGQGMTRDPVSGLVLIRKAADTWNPDALLALAEIYANGLGHLTPNPQEAAKWLAILGGGPRAYNRSLGDTIGGQLGLSDVDREAANRSAKIWIDAHPKPERATVYSVTIWQD